jgi:hypothetical protein
MAPSTFASAAAGIGSPANTRDTASEWYVVVTGRGAEDCPARRVAPAGVAGQDIRDQQ